MIQIAQSWKFKRFSVCSKCETKLYFKQKNNFEDDLTFMMYT